jgi:hypothetical protein
MVAALRCSVDASGGSDEALGVMVALGSDPNWLVPALLQVAMDATDDATADAAVTAVTEQVADHFTTKVAAPSADAWLNWSIAHMSRLDPESPIVTRRFERLCAAMPRSPTNGPTLADVAADTERVPATRRAAALKALWRYPMSPQVQSVDLLASYLTTATPEVLFEAAAASILRAAQGQRSNRIEEAAVMCMPALLASAWRPAAAKAAVALLGRYPEDLLQLADEYTSSKHIEWLGDVTAPRESRLGVCELLCTLHNAVGPPTDADVLKKVIAAVMDLLAEESNTLFGVTTPLQVQQHATNTTAILRLLAGLVPTADSDSDESNSDDDVSESQRAFLAIFAAELARMAGRDEWQSRQAAATAVQCLLEVPNADMPVEVIARLVNDTNVIVRYTALQASLAVVIDHLPTITEHAVAMLRDESNTTSQWVVLSALTTLFRKLMTTFVKEFVATDSEPAEDHEDATKQTAETTVRHVAASTYVVRKWIPVVSEVMNRTANPFTFAAAGNLLALLCQCHATIPEDRECLDRDVVISVFDSTRALLHADCQRFQPAAVRLTTLAGDEATMTDSMYDEVAAACALSAVHVELLSVVTALVSKYKEFIPSAPVMDLFRLVRAQGSMSAAIQSVLRFYNFFVKAFPERVAGVVDVILPHVLLATTIKLLPAVRASSVPRHLRQTDTNAASLWGNAQMVPHPSSVEIQKTIWEGAGVLSALLEWAAESSEAAATLSSHAFDLADTVLALSRSPLVSFVQDGLGSLHQFIGHLVAHTAAVAPSGAMLALLIHAALGALHGGHVLFPAWDGLGEAIQSNVELIEDPSNCRNASPAAAKLHATFFNQAVGLVLRTVHQIAVESGVNDVTHYRFMENISSVLELAFGMQPRLKSFKWVLSKMRQLGSDSPPAHHAQLMLAAQILYAFHTEVGLEFTTEFLTLTSASSALATTAAGPLDEMTIKLVEAGFFTLEQIAATYDAIREEDPDNPMAALFLPPGEVLLHAPTPLGDVLLHAPMDYLNTSIARDPGYADTTSLAVASLLRACATGRLLGVDTVELAEAVLSTTVAHLPLTTDNEELRCTVYGTLVRLFGDGTLASSRVSAELKTCIARAMLRDAASPDTVIDASLELIKLCRADQEATVIEEPQRKRHNSRR